MLLWGMSQKWCKLWIAIEHTDTLDDVSVVKLEFLSCNLNLLPNELREPIWELFVNYLVEFF